MLPVQIGSLTVKNPVMVSAGPWTRGYHRIKKAFDAGAGLVVTESIVSEPYPEISPRFAYDGHGMQNIRIYSGIGLEDWMHELTLVAKEKKFGSQGLLMGNIMASTPSEIGYLARKVEKAGVDALEIGLACPMGEGAEIVASNAEKVFEFVNEAVKSVSIPVFVKVTQSMNNLVKVVHSIEKAGACGISAIDTLRGIVGIDISTGKPILPTYGGYSGVPIRPMGLATVAGIAQSTKLPILGIGGIANYGNLLEYIMLGASMGGVGTEVMLRGMGVVTEMLKSLEGWIEENQVKDWNGIRGCSLKELRSFEELKPEIKIAELHNDCKKKECGVCLNCCLEEAISFQDGRIKIDQDLCSGCGACLGVCPERWILLKWKS